MADTVETLRAEIDMLKATLSTFMDYALPVIDAHQQPPAGKHPPMARMPTEPNLADYLPQEPPDYTPDIPTPPGVTWPPNVAP